MDLEAELLRCIQEQERISEELKVNYCFGAWLGLQDWLKEECCIRKELNEQHKRESARHAKQGG